MFKLSKLIIKKTLKINKVALKIPRMIKILDILKITIIASKPLNLAMLE